ncbi:MAG: FAD-binding protein [Deltaproteobacteria bacterium]|nr:FAD-binding protein [Deltaproteobacteria bacterium]
MKKVTGDIWVYVDLRNKKYFEEGLNLLGAAKGLAGLTAGKTIALFMDAGDKDTPNHIKGISPEEASAVCVSNGADSVFILEHDDLSLCRPDVHARAVTTLVKDMTPRMVLFPLSDMGREIASSCAAYCDAGLIADCVEFTIEDNRIIAGCPSWGGEIMARLTWGDPEITGFATVPVNAFSPCNIAGNPGEIKRIRINGEITSDRLKRISHELSQEGHRKLEDAEIVVVGGAGVGTSEGFAMVRRLAAAIGGEIGATRPPVINHWVDEERLIGQTGKTIHPRLLFTIGTSGAVQYTAGITGSEYIVAINRDPLSPVFHVADAGIVADARTVMPLITNRLKQLTMRELADSMGEGKVKEKGTGIGEKIRKIRNANNWTIEYLAEKTDQTPEFIEKVENGEMVPSVSFLLKLSRALGVDPGTFLSDEEKAQIEDKRAKAFITRTKNYAYQTLTPGAENQHLRGFMITIEAKQDHKPVAYKHEGEEFIYVMEGSLEITLDSKITNLKIGESMHYNSEIPHKLRNVGNETTRCLVMLYTP